MSAKVVVRPRDPAVSDLELPRSVSRPLDVTTPHQRFIATPRPFSRPWRSEGSLSTVFFLAQSE